MKFLVHAGYPKSGSTWLQRYFFSVHPSLFHLGKFDNGRIVDDDVRLALFSDFVEKPDYLYDCERTGRVFDNFLHREYGPEVKYISLSSELFCHYYFGKVDLTRKAERLAGALKNNAKVLIVIRNQIDWIRSLYSGLLKEGGLTRTFEEFLFHFVHLKDRSGFASLFYDKVFDTYAAHFGGENVCMVPFEWLKVSHDFILGELCTRLGLDVIDSDYVSGKAGKIVKSNEGMSGEQLYRILELNRKRRIYLGGDHLHPVWSHTIKPIFHMYGAEMSESINNDWDAILENAILARRRGGRLKRLLNKPKILSLDFPEEYLKILREAYAPVNARCSERIGIDLNELGYPG